MWSERITIINPATNLSSYEFWRSTWPKKVEAAPKIINTIEKPNTPDRQQWLNDLGYAHWSLNEIRNGEYWTRVKDQILKEHNG